jgi:NADH-quinone oxidoreductase subunit L
VLAGWLGTPKIWNLSEGFHAFERWLAFPVAETKHGASTEWLLMGISVAVALAGIAIARYFYIIRTEIPDRIASAIKPLYNGSFHKWYVDEIYDFLFVDGMGKAGGRALGAFDRTIVDGGVNGAGWLTRFSSRLSIWWDTWIIDGAVRFSSFFVRMLSFPACVLQTGRVQGYAFCILVGVLVFLGYYVTR